MVQGLVTVVIPIYNVEKFLDRCLNSIVQQTYRNLEVILVDDGSTDSCPALCDEWVKKDSRIKVVHKANAGLGMARNTGIDNANGEYICFIDSDDFISLNTIELIYNKAITDFSDVVIYGMNNSDINGNVMREHVLCPPKTYYHGSEIIEEILPRLIIESSKENTEYNFHMSSCACLFSMKMICENNWRFVSEREHISEDYYSLLVLYQYVHSFSVICDSLYSYCMNTQSLTHTFDPTRYKRVANCYIAMKEKCDEIGYPEKVRKSLSVQFLGNVIGALKTVVNSDSNYKQKMAYLSEIVSDPIVVSAIKDIDLEYESKARKLLLICMKHRALHCIYLAIKLKT